jgi:hypothetical protein
MFKPSLYALALHRLGLSRRIRAALFLVFFGSFVAGLIYTAVVFHALTERNRAPHVQHHSVR